MLYVEGSPRLQAAVERIGWSFDWTEKLVDSQTVSSATLTVTRLEDDADVTAATAIGGVVVASPYTTVTIGHLVARKRYRVDVLATLSGGSLQVASLELRVPY